MHVLPLQTCPEAQAVPQAAQSLLSVVRSRQTPPQLVVPAPQLTAHVPALHTWPAAHAWPHAPQFATSDLTLSQTPPQSVRPA